MMSFATVDRKIQPNSPAYCPALSRQARQHPCGEMLYAAGHDGLAWRVQEGVVRLDTLGSDGQRQFASLAIAGDIIGCETLLFGAYTFSACALTACTLNPWPEGRSAPAGDSLLATLANAQRRAADVIALRGGQAIDRVLGLARLLSDRHGQVVLPTRQDIADITDLRFETISRIVKQLERAGRLLPIKLDGVHATRSFQLSELSSAGGLLA